MSKHSKAQQVVIDAIEGQLARVEFPDGSTRDMPLAELPKGVKEGDVVTLGEQPSVSSRPRASWMP